jgi:3-hydroxymyristoyl/3-hydroxydecanoyl-(acyl carrier protein) dehydratase
MPVSNAARISRDTAIAASHPCLPGHFPGNPIVPGVLLLDSIGHILQQWKPSCRIAGIAQAKFHQLLRPEQRVTITLTEQNPRSIKFVCFREHEKIASGVLQIEIPS